MRETRDTALLHVSCGKPATRRYCMYHAGNPRDGATTCMGATFYKTYYKLPVSMFTCVKRQPVVINNINATQ